MYNLLEYSKNYAKTSGTLWNYSKDISNDPITNSESFKYKKVLQETTNDRDIRKVKFSV